MSKLHSMMVKVAKSLQLQLETGTGPFAWRGTRFSLSPDPSSKQLERFLRRCDRLHRRQRLRLSLNALERERILIANLLHRTACQSLTVLSLECELIADSETRATFLPLVQQLNSDFRKVYDFLTLPQGEGNWLDSEFGLTRLDSFPQAWRRALLAYLVAARSRHQGLAVVKTNGRIEIDLGPRAPLHRRDLGYLEVGLRQLGSSIELEDQKLCLTPPKSGPEQTNEENSLRCTNPLNP